LLANITNPKTRRGYRIDVAEFLAFTGLLEPTSLRGRSNFHRIHVARSYRRPPRPEQFSGDILSYS
jgi:hypothetical protein